LSIFRRGFTDKSRTARADRSRLVCHRRGGLPPQDRRRWNRRRV